LEVNFHTGAIMWVFTKYGFFSVVCARTGDGGKGSEVDYTRVQVRARVKEHLLELMRRFNIELEILETPAADYRFRIVMAKSDWSSIAAKVVAEVDYVNFKSEAGRRESVLGMLYEEALHEVWSVMHGLQERWRRIG
jgi:hypothetical protein